MTLTVRTSNGMGNLDIKLPGPHSAEVGIGELQLSVADACEVAFHTLSGGYHGWKNNETPASVNLALNQLFELYERRDGGKWVRKEKEAVS